MPLLALLATSVILAPSTPPPCLYRHGDGRTSALFTLSTMKPLVLQNLGPGVRLVLSFDREENPYGIAYREGMAAWYVTHWHATEADAIAHYKTTKGIA